MKYRPDIDGLRAVAVLSVVLCHAGIALPGGYVGVDVFFVLSGYLIASLMLKDVEAGTFSLAQFWERRVRRILPALVVVVAASFICGWFLLVPKAYQMFGRSVFSLMLLESNCFFARHTDYFGSADQAQPLLHTWSLSVEEQFYLIVPLLFWGAMRAGRQSWLRPTVAALAVMSFLASVYGESLWSHRAYFALSTRAWELLAGVLTALFWRPLPRASGPIRELAAGLGLAGIVLPCFCYSSATPFPGPAALPPVLGTVLLILCGGCAERSTRVQRLLASPPAVSLGLISYSFYLWHWPLIVFLKLHSKLPWPVLGQAFLLVGALALAVLTYRCVERPFRRRDFLQTRPRLIAATVSVCLALLAAGRVLRDLDGVVDRLPAQAQLLARTAVDVDACFRLHRAEDVPHSLFRAGAADVEPSLLVWGDSHAGVLMPVIHEMCASSHLAARCAMYPGRPPVIHHCTQTSQQALAEANAFGAAVNRYARSRDIDTVLLVGFWSLYFPQADFADSLLETVDELRAAGRRVYFMKDVPKYEFNVAASLILYQWQGKDLDALAFPLQDYDAQNFYHATILPRLVERGVKILDPIPYLRDKAGAAAIRPSDDGGSFYYDNNHLSLYGVRTIRPVFAPVIDDLRQSAAAQVGMQAKTPLQTADTAERTLR